LQFTLQAAVLIDLVKCFVMSQPGANPCANLQSQQQPQTPEMINTAEENRASCEAQKAASYAWLEHVKISTTLKI
jgi:hypothetical protein